MKEEDKYFSHLVEVDEEKKLLKIYRIHKNGKRFLYTEITFPNKSFADDPATFGEFAKLIGENLIADSPAARNLLKI